MMACLSPSRRSCFACCDCSSSSSLRRNASRNALFSCRICSSSSCSVILVLYQIGQSSCKCDALLNGYWFCVTRIGVVVKKLLLINSFMWQVPHVNRLLKKRERRELLC